MGRHEWCTAKRPGEKIQDLSRKGVENPEDSVVEFRRDDFYVKKRERTYLSKNYKLILLEDEPLSRPEQ